MKRIRKQFYDLTGEDLSRFPTWKFALDEIGEPDCDEATVRPYRVKGTLNPDSGMFIVRTDFVLADGTFMHGYITPAVSYAEGLPRMAGAFPSILSGSQPVSLYTGPVRPPRTYLSWAYKCLQKSSKQVFPLRYKILVAIKGVPSSGTFDGFAFSRDSSHLDEIRYAR